MSDQLPDAKIAQIHRHYDAKFRALMRNMAADVSNVLKDEKITAVALNPVVQFQCSSKSSPGLSARLITFLYVEHAKIEFTIHYAGEPK